MCAGPCTQRPSVDGKWRGWLDIVLEVTSNGQCPDVGRRERYVLHGNLDR